MAFNPTRLGIARKRRNLNKKKLALTLGVSQQTLVRWDSHEDAPTLQNVEAMSRELDFPVEFFFGEDIDEPNLEIASFRSQTAMSAAARDAALAAGAIGFEISDWVDANFNLPEPDLLDLNLYDPEGAAQALRQEWGLGEKPISNIVHLLESKGVRVFSLCENTRHVNAFSLWRLGRPYVFLNTFKSAESSRFDAAHELCHLVLHQDGKVRGREAEDQAQRFASAFLMPRADVLAQLPRVHTLQQLISGKKRWRVSLAALNYRLHKMGVITDWKNRDFCITISRLGYNKHEPEGIERESSIVWNKVIKSLWSEQKTHFDIASKLHLPPQEVSDLIFGMLNVPNTSTSAEQSSLSLLDRENGASRIPF